MGNGVLFFASSTGEYTVAYDFPGGKLGANPNNIVMDSSGNVFGSAAGGTCPDSKNGCGVIFEYKPRTNAYSVIYTFPGGDQGYEPMLGAVAPDGTLYGVTLGGQYRGTLFALHPSAGAYTYSMLAAFKALTMSDGPPAPPTLASNGDIVGPMRGYIYGYSHGHLNVLGVVGPDLPINTVAPLAAGPGSVIYGTSLGNGETPCIFSSGQSLSNGCGNIFSYKLEP